MPLFAKVQRRLLSWIGSMSQDDDEMRKQHDVRRLNRALLPLFGLALLAALLKGVETQALAPVLMWTVACIASGGTAGFLFGIPRSGTVGKACRAPAADGAREEPEPEPAIGSIAPNTNLEEVSDWLTKIIVGLTLVNLDDIQGAVVAVGAVMAGALGTPPSPADRSFGIAPVAGFFVLGVLSGYLYTRPILQRGFRTIQSKCRQQVAVQKGSKRSLFCSRVCTRVQGSADDG